MAADADNIQTAIGFHFAHDGDHLGRADIQAYDHVAVIWSAHMSHLLSPTGHSICGYRIFTD